MPKLTYSPTKGLLQESGAGVFLNGAQLTGALSKVFVVSTGNVANAGDLTLTANDSGCIVSLQDTRQGVALVLPTATSNAGFWCDVVTSVVSASGNTSITGGTFILTNIVGGAATDAETAGTTLTVDASKDTAGDRVRIISDGVSYVVRGASSTAAAFAAS